MNHYKVKKEHPDHFEVHDERDGRTFKVAKKNLGSLEGKVRKMWQAGEVESPDDEQTSAPNIFPVEGNDASIQSAPAPLESSWNPNMQVSAPQTGPFPGANMAPPETFAQANPNMQVAEKPETKGSPSRENPNTVAPTFGQEAAMQKTSVPTGSVSSDNAASSGDVIKAIQQGAKAQQEAAAAQSKIAADNAKQMQDLQAAGQQKFAAIDAENKQLQDDIAASKIDPHRMWSNASTGNKILAGIGVLLSGIGSGMSGQKNMAMEVINKAIDADVQAQTAELGKKQNLLSMNYRKYGDLQAAQSATASQLSSVAQSQIAAASARAGSAQAQSSAAIAIAQLKQQEAQRNQALAMDAAKTEIFNQGGSQNLTPAMAESLAPGRWVNTPAGIKIAKTPDDAKKLADATQVMSTLDSSLKEMEKFNKTVGTTWGGSSNSKTAERLKTDLALQLKDLYQLGVLSEKDGEMLDKVVPNIGGMRSDVTATQIQGVKRLVQNRIQQAYGSRLVNPSGLVTPPTAAQDQSSGLSLTNWRK